MNLECQRNLITASQFSSNNLKQRSLYVSEQNSYGLLYGSSELYGVCHRNSAVSSSSHDSSSDFGSVESGSSHDCLVVVTQGAICPDTLSICGSSSDLLLHSSHSRLSMQSSSSGDASFIMNNIRSVFDDSAASETDWLPLIGLPEYITLFENEEYCKVSEIQNFRWEDFEDIGIEKLGHLKRLGLAIKEMKNFRSPGCFHLLFALSTEQGKLKLDSLNLKFRFADHEFGRNQLNSDLHQLVAVTVHRWPGMFPTDYDDLLSRVISPPLAQISTFCPANLGSLCDNHYSTEKQCLHLCKDFSAKLHAQKQKIQMYPHYQPTIANGMISHHFQGCDQQSLDCGLNKRKTDSLQMDLYSLSQILSDGSLQKYSVIREQLSMLPTEILSAGDNSITSDSEDDPSPPPAPLACEGSIQLLKSAFNESAVATTTESGIVSSSNFEQHCSEINSFSLNKQFSFANDNCGVIKSRDGLSLEHKYNEKPANSSFSQLNTTCRSHSISTRHGDVLNDIASMLQNLTDELNTMLLPSKSIRYSCGKQIPF
ncbi:Ankyrin repeat-containing protein [Dirofilaria immitis]|nr:Ankyrin repeat-containing protein [Dirofilaria immitis]